MNDKKKEPTIESVQPTDNTAKDPTKTCFVMMPIADVDRYTPGHFSRVYQYIIEPACRAAGFEPTLASQVKAANVIMVDILERILNADMVVCDISDRNPNVLYELGIRQAFDGPVTLMKDDITRDIFDIQGIRYVPYNHQLRIDQVADTVRMLAESITETYENKNSGIFSLVQILGREKAEIRSSKLSDETKIILEAIDELRIRSNRQGGSGVPSYDLAQVVTPGIKFEYFIPLPGNTSKDIVEITTIINTVYKFFPRAEDVMIRHADLNNIVAFKHHGILPDNSLKDLSIQIGGLGGHGRAQIY